MTLEPQAAPAAVAVLRDALRDEQPSPALDARIEDAIRRHAARAPLRKRVLSVRLPGPAIAAGVTAVLVAGLVVWALGERTSPQPGDAPGEQPGAYETLDAASPQPDAAHALNAARALDAGSAMAPAGYAVEPTGAYSLWPTESAVFRVQARLDAMMPGFVPAAGARDEQRFWVDVRVANDGTMRIVRIVPVDEGA